jgi:putative CocE/NonD family hydrolase
MTTISFDDRKPRLNILPLLFVFFLGCGGSDTRKAPPGAVSEFGKYEKYSEPQYEEWVRSSQYVTMRDGVNLAVDIVRPAVNGEPVGEPLPLVWTHARYHRAREEDGVVYSLVDRRPFLQLLVQHGYIVAAVDVRGSGASYGRYEGVYSEAETRDAYEMTEWFAAQPWCDGNVGMYGGSYLGMAQYMAASQAPPHLKAIFPSMAGFDLYSLVYTGCVFRDDFIDHWGNITRNLDINQPAPVVDEDPEGEKRAEAIRQHEDNWDPRVEARKTGFRDGEYYENEFRPMNPSEHIAAINRSGVPVYQWSAWFDIYTRDAFRWLENLEAPNRLTLGPWGHGTSDPKNERDRFYRIELLRWFDYWLKGIDNGVLEEPPIHYATMVDPETWTWNTADTWPLPEAKSVSYYFSEGPSGSVSSVNDGVLSPESPSQEEGEDAYQVDYTTTTGAQSRWANGYGAPMDYPDMTENDRKGLTYTTEPLSEDINVTGHPVVTLYISSTASDGDFFVHLEEVDAEGYSHYVTEGVLRASHRALSDAPYDNLGLPFHGCNENEMETLSPGDVASLVFDLFPTSNVFNAGNRIRITVTCADQENMETPELTPPPTVRLYRNRQYSSHVSLPIVESGAKN